MVIDKGLTLLNVYSNPQLGEDILVMPTSSDIMIIIVNTIISSVFAWMVLRRIKASYL